MSEVACHLCLGLGVVKDGHIELRSQLLQRGAFDSRLGGQRTALRLKQPLAAL